ncbi:hypothetical protein [Corynebacterium diphtheriae]|uniref:Uncharacterized protein n=1 Tax=Corynebacterium diphtheriae bv. mitis TaxID=1806053 RepID=A0A854NFV6_CORDP|nr:hypothetical protein [Corynebacterium diphtheriae]KKA82433.1 hypothetical protein VN94_03475 [Corynebacterium diphtheriae]MBG9227830.1 hypothetical protein [Corynebacterium diphtheriae bv. gravis]MBG9250281.1 hypothetical protein [Corynebacterium diphtheriae bv. mitis]MBG9254537.1 hypothetical protein [Corynebacterium diphtheriae bv. mitis]MBG9261300.1 hypothetical protein [Corynebacterium diphtheriae bv. mitis]
MGNIFIKLHLLDALRKKSSYAAVVKGCCAAVRLCGRAAVNAAFYWLLATKKQFSTHDPVSPHNLLEI